MRTLPSVPVIANVITLMLLPMISSASQATPPRPAIGAFGVDLTGMDRTIRPGDDFYRYVNGRWEAATQIPADRSWTGVASTLQDRSDVQVRSLIEEAAAHPEPRGSEAQKIAKHTGAIWTKRRSSVAAPHPSLRLWRGSTR